MPPLLLEPEKSLLTPLKRWIPAAAPLMTRWAHTVSPSHARPEYPRPQAVRAQWKSLNGLWDFSMEQSEDGTVRMDQQILVPFTFESALSGIGQGKEVREHVWYRRNFEVPQSWAGKRVVLHFGAVDWEATVWVNGQEIGRHRGGYTPFSFDITDSLTGSGPQELVVQAYDPAATDPHSHGMEFRSQSATQPMGKQLGSTGIWYTRSTGIWQSVWLEPVADSHLGQFELQPSLESGELAVSAEVFGPFVGSSSAKGSSDNPSRTLQLKVKVVRNGITIAQQKFDVDSTLMKVSLKVPDPLPWSPENPALYDVYLSLRDGRRVLDHVRSYCGFRTIGAKDGRITLNGEPYVLRGVLDQGYWPDGIYTAPSIEGIRDDLVKTKEMGFNVSRKHAKIEEPHYYYLCDTMGIMVVQDMPSSQDLSSQESRDNFLNEWTEVVETLRNHPSIAIWVPFNEDWGKPGEFQDTVADYTHMVDPSRLVIDASGWTQRSKTDIVDRHEYSNNLKQYASTALTKPQWIGEYGGVALPVVGHTWSQWWGYQSVKSPSQYLKKAAFLTAQISVERGFSGYCFTQLTDVEQELNGLMTYDRVPKASLEQFAEIFGQA